MGPGVQDPVVKEMIYLVISISNNCDYCIASHSTTAQNAGTTYKMFGELMGIAVIENENNYLYIGYRFQSMMYSFKSTTKEKRLAGQLQTFQRQRGFVFDLLQCEAGLNIRNAFHLGQSLYDIPLKLSDIAHDNTNEIIRIP